MHGNGTPKSLCHDNKANDRVAVPERGLYSNHLKPCLAPGSSRTQPLPAMAGLGIQSDFSKKKSMNHQALLQNRPLFLAICPDSLWARDNRWLLSRVQRLAGPAGGQGPFVPVGASNRDKRPWAPYPLPSPPARAIQLTCFFAVLGSGLRSSCSFLHHICEDL